MTKLKNVVVVNDFNYIQGGASKVAIQTANILKKNNPKLNIYFFSGDSNEKSILDKRIINISTNQGEFLKDRNKFRGIKNGIYNNFAKNKLRELLKKLNNNETIIHIHGWTKCLSTSVFDICHEMNFKVIITMHDYFTACPNGGYFNFKKNEICKLSPMTCKCVCTNCDSRNYLFKLYRLIRQMSYKKTYKNLKYVIAISDFSLAILKKTLPKNIYIERINNPIDFDINQSSNKSVRKNYYLYVGRVSKEKGVDIFCEALTKLKLPGIVVGDGDQKIELEKNFPNISFVGWKSEKEVKEYMRKSKCLVMPSKLYECAPLTNLEALSVGVPSLVSDNCAARDVSNEKNNTGQTFKLDNLVECIKKFETKTKNGKKYNNKEILNNYSVDAYLNKIIELYNKLLNERGN